jgi:hypothetical protein
LSEEIPSSVVKKGALFECEYGHQWDTSTYNGLKSGNGCIYCSGCARLTLDDYQKIAHNKGTYILDYIPKNNNTKIDGWNCNNCKRVYSTCYAFIRRGDWCSCKNIRNYGWSLTLEDYQIIAFDKGEYILNYPLRTVNTVENAWRCYNCNNLYKASYSSIRTGQWCNCHFKKDLNDYRNATGDRGIYILDIIPQNTNVPIAGWLCNNCNTIRTACYSNVVRGSWCTCSTVKNINDYKTICEAKGTYILDTIPQNTQTLIKGWLCNECNNIHTASYTNIQQGHWCSCVRNKTEFHFKKFIIEFFPEVIHQFSPEWLINPKTNHQLSYDFMIELDDKFVIIEIDGLQHFRNVKHFSTSCEKVRRRDVFKMMKALNNGYYLIRLHQDDVLYNRNNWKEMLFEQLNDLNDTPTIIFCCVRNIYAKHMEDLENYDDLDDEIVESLISLKI